MDLASQRVEIRDGLTLDYVDRGDPDGRALVLIPGLGDSWHSYGPVLEQLPSSIRTIAVSQRGHGDSGRHRSYRFNDFVDDISAFLDALKIEAAFLAGHSSHGLVIEKFAIDNPERGLGLILIATPVTLRGHTAAKEIYETTISKLVDPIDEEFVRDFTGSTLAQPVPQAFLDTALAETAKVPARVFKELFEDLIDLDFSNDLDKIEAPVLLLRGGRDAILSRSEQDALALAIPNAHQVVYPHAGHAPHWEQPGRFTADAVSFIS